MLVYIISFSQNMECGPTLGICCYFAIHLYFMLPNIKGSKFRLKVLCKKYFPSLFYFTFCNVFTEISEMKWWKCSFYLGKNIPSLVYSLYPSAIPSEKLSYILALLMVPHQDHTRVRMEGIHGKYDKFRTSGHCTNWTPGISKVTGWGFLGGLHVQFASSIDLLIPSESLPPHLQRKHLPRANQHEGLCIFSDVISIPAGGWDQLDTVLWQALTIHHHPDPECRYIGICPWHWVCSSGSLEQKNNLLHESSR